MSNASFSTDLFICQTKVQVETLLKITKGFSSFGILSYKETVVCLGGPKF